MKIRKILLLFSIVSFYGCNEVLDSVPLDLYFHIIKFEDANYKYNVLTEPEMLNYEYISKDSILLQVHPYTELKDNYLLTYPYRLSFWVPSAYVYNEKWSSVIGKNDWRFLTVLDTIPFKAVYSFYLSDMEKMCVDYKEDMIDIENPVDKFYLNPEIIKENYSKFKEQQNLYTRVLNKVIEDNRLKKYARIVTLY